MTANAANTSTNEISAEIEDSSPLAFEPGSDAALVQKYSLPGAEFDFDDLKDIAKICINMALEAGRIEANFLKDIKAIDPDILNSILSNEHHLREIFLPTFTIADNKGNRISGRDLSVFDNDHFPKDVLHFFCATGATYFARRNVEMRNRAVLFIDFVKFPIRIDFEAVPANRTPNETNLEINSRDRGWAADFHNRILQEFQDTPTTGNWLHRSSIYDLLILFVVFPSLSYFMYILDTQILTSFLIGSDALRFFFYLCIFFASLVFFRLLFSYARWAFPLYEYAGRAGRHRGSNHRRTIYAILSGYIAACLFEITRWTIFH